MFNLNVQYYHFIIKKILLNEISFFQRDFVQKKLFHVYSSIPCVFITHIAYIYKFSLEKICLNEFFYS